MPDVLEVDGRAATLSRAHALSIFSMDLPLLKDFCVPERKKTHSRHPAVRYFELPHPDLTAKAAEHSWGTDACCIRRRCITGKDSPAMHVVRHLAMSRVPLLVPAATIPRTNSHKHARSRACPNSTPMETQRSLLSFFDHLHFKGALTGIGQTVLATVFLSPKVGVWLRRGASRLWKALKGWKR